MLADDGAATMTSTTAIEFQMIGSSIFQKGGEKNIQRDRKMTQSVKKSSLLSICVRLQTKSDDGSFLKEFLSTKFIIDLLTTQGRVDSVHNTTAAGLI